LAKRRGYINKLTVGFEPMLKNPYLDIQKLRFSSRVIHLRIDLILLGTLYVSACTTNIP